MANLLDYHTCNNEDVWLDGFRVTYPKVKEAFSHTYYLKLMTTANAWQGLQCCDSELPTCLTVCSHVFSLLVKAGSFAISNYAY